MTFRAADNHTLRMATNFLKSGKDLEPTRISSLQEYELVRNLYSRLVEYNTNGELVAGVADSFEWHDQELVFTFGKKVTTIDGHTITAEDAALSLKRAILFEKTGHGDLRNFLCPGTRLYSIHDNCPGIHFAENKLFLRPVTPSVAGHVLALIESADFSIIPKVSLSADPKNPEIVSHRNTSGPFYAEKDSAEGAWLLKANPNHYLFSSVMPQEIQLIPTDGSNIAELFIEKRIDLIPTPLFFGGPLLEPLLKDKSQFSVHESIPIKVRMICFSPSALRRFTVEQRLFAASLVENYLTANFPIPGSKPTVELFQALSDGSLPQGKRLALRETRDKLVRPKFDQPITVGAAGGTFEKVRAALANFPEVKVVKTDVSSYLMPLDERPDMYVVSSDSAWTESLSLLGHNFRIGIFHLPGVDGDKWIKSYAEIEDREKRIEALSALHENLLKSVVIYPISVSPYYAVAHKPWTLSFSTFSAGTELWRISREQ